jgi:hypothetical protein
MKKIAFTLILLVWLYPAFAQTIIWKQLASLPEGYRNGEAVTLNDKIFFVTAGPSAGNPWNRFFYKYDPTTNIWTKLADLPGATQNLALAGVNGKIYAIGGDSFRKTNYEYTPETNTWITLSPMPTARQHIDCGISENKIYVIGGITSWETITKKNEVYDVASNNWSEKSEIPSLRNNPAIVTLDSLIYVIGGAGSDTDIWNNIATVECYNTKTDTWEQKADLPYVLFKPAAVVVKSQILVLGGITTVNDLGVCTDKVLLYNAGTDEWKEITPLPDTNIFFGCTTIENKIYVICGQKGVPPNVSLYSTVYEGELLTSSSFDEHQQNKIQIYPNPSNNIISIKNLDDKYDDLIYKVISVNGHIVQQGKLTSPTISCSSLASGLYLLVIEKNNCPLFHEKFVVE